MYKHLIAGFTALSLCLAAPAQAQALDREDAARLVIGLGALAVVGAAIRNNRDDDDSATEVHDRHDRNDWNRRNNGNRWSDLNRRSNNRVLPGECLQRIETRFGTQRLFGQRCLERNYRHVNQLPGRCAVRVYTRRGPQTGYDPLCLREAGYASDRRW